MDLIAIINFLLIAGVIQGFVFNLVTIFIKKKFNKVIIFLNLVVLIISLNNLQAWLIDNGYSSDIFFIKGMEIPWYFLAVPFFYVFLVHFLRIQDKVKDFLKLSLAIFCVELIVRVVLLLYVYNSVEDLDTTILDQYTAYEEIVNMLYCLFLFGKSVNLVYKKQNMFKFILSYDDLKWIKLFLKLSAVVLLIWIIAVLMSNIYESDLGTYPLRLSTSIILYWIGYQGFYRYNVVNDRIFLRRSISSESALLISEGKINQSPEKDDFVNDKHKREFDSINDNIIKNQKFLDPYLGMENLASDLNISISHFSKLINAFSSNNFSDYINYLRVEQAKKLLGDQTFNQYTIVAIGLESGFNSKSTFYSAFKKFTSQTPTDYKASFN